MTCGIKAAALLLVSACAMHDGANAQPITGNVRLNHYSSSKDLDDRHGVWAATAQVQHTADYGEQFESRIDWRFEAPDIERGSRLRERLIEGHLRWRGEHMRATLGRQIVAWGRADALNPTDNLSPRDYRVKLPFEEDQRFGSTGAKLEVFASERSTATLYASPLFSPHRIPQQRDDGVEEHRPDDRTWTAAAKWDRRGDELDWSISWLRGFSLTPELRATSSGSVARFYPRIQVFGADAAYNFARWAWRGEVARVLREEDDRLGTGMRSHWSIVAGADRGFDDGLNLNLQLVFKQGDRIATKDPGRQGVADINAVMFGQYRRRLFGYTARLRRDWANDTWRGEIAVVGYVGPRSSQYVRPLLSYAVSDQVRVTVGADWYFGREGGIFTTLKPNRAAFAEVRFALY